MTLNLHQWTFVVSLTYDSLVYKNCLLRPSVNIFKGDNPNIECLIYPVPTRCLASELSGVKSCKI